MRSSEKVSDSFLLKITQISLSNSFWNFYGNYSTFVLIYPAIHQKFLLMFSQKTFMGFFRTFFFHKEFYLRFLKEFLLSENLRKSLWYSSWNITRSFIWDFCRILFWGFRKKFLPSVLQGLLLDSLQSRL